MTVTIRMATLNEPWLWDELHARAAMPSQSRSYGAAFATADRHPRIALVEGNHGGFLSLVFHTRDWKGTQDICTILSVSGSAAQAPLQDLAEGWSAFARTQGWVAGYLQFAPEVTADSLPGLSEGNQVFLLDLQQADPLVAASQLIRRKVRRAAAAGALLVEDRSQLADALVRLYPDTLLRVGASAAYAMAPQALRELAMAPDILILGGAVETGIESVMVFPTAGSRAEFFINAGSLRGRDLNAWLLVQAMDRLAATGHRRLNLGGGVRSGDGLYRFKAMFGAPAVPLGVLRQVYRPDIYARLCAESGLPSHGAWFPAYRAPSRSLQGG